VRDHPGLGEGATRPAQVDRQVGAQPGEAFEVRLVELLSWHQFHANIKTCLRRFGPVGISPRPAPSVLDLGNAPNATDSGENALRTRRVTRLQQFYKIRIGGPSLPSRNGHDPL
jgi:hypothetical protein